MKYIKKLSIDNGESVILNGDYVRDSGGITSFVSSTGNTISLQGALGWVVTNTQLNEKVYIIDHAFADIEKYHESADSEYDENGNVIGPTEDYSTTAQIQAIWA